MDFLSLLISFVLKSILSDIKIATPSWFFIFIIFLLITWSVHIMNYSHIHLTVLQALPFPTPLCSPTRKKKTRNMSKRSKLWYLCCPYTNWSMVKLSEDSHFKIIESLAFLPFILSGNRLWTSTWFLSIAWTIDIHSLSSISMCHGLQHVSGGNTDHTNQHITLPQHRPWTPSQPLSLICNIDQGHPQGPQLQHDQSNQHSC